MYLFPPRSKNGSKHPDRSEGPASQLMSFGSGSLLWRLTVPCLFGLVCVGALNTGSWLHKFQTEIESAVLERSMETTAVMANAVVEAVWDYDVDGASQILGGFGNLENLVFVEISADGQSFVRHQTALSETIAVSLQSPDAQRTPHLSEDGRIILFTHPVVHPNWGTIGVLMSGFSLEQTQNLLTQTRNRTILSQLLSFGVLGILLIFVLKSVTQPLRRITRIIEDVTGGDLQKDVPFKNRRDEVGRLATAVAVFQQNASRLVEIQAEAETNRRIAESALIDDLTKLPNRRALMGLFEQLDTDEDAQRENNIVLLHMDLDGFKQINDTLGHKAGDHILEIVAARLRDTGQHCRMVARIGGDEFVAVIVLSDGGIADVPALADQLIAALRKPTEFEGQSIRVGCSIGIGYHTARNRDLLDTLVQADIALYRAKANGKNQAVEFDEIQRKVMVQRKSLADQLQLAIERDEFVPYFQPIVDAHTHNIVAVEVLARWQHPDMGLVGPARFLDLATELKLMRFVDRNVLSKAIAAMTDVSAEIRKLPRMSVNVSVDRLMENDLLETLAVVEGSGLNVDVEILESSYLDDLETQVLWQLDKLRDMGVGIHIDDFGTGHSSVAGLLKLRPDVMKIDRQFIGPATQSAKDRAVVEALIAIARSFDIQVTCEGVETTAQAGLMQQLGADRLQGYFFHKPMDGASLRALLHQMTDLQAQRTGS